MAKIQAEIRLSTQDVQADIPFFTGTLGMRLDMIYPADNPRIAVFSGHGIQARVEKGAPEGPATIRILTDDPIGFADGAVDLTAPNGTKIEVRELNPALEFPVTEHEFVVRPLVDNASWIIGRAGMNYRDLVPSRLGGAMIASHIRIPGGGPVPDMVHFHKVGFQLIFCYKGWVDVLYEDQGDRIRLTTGDCFIQPPEIRHRVMESSADLEVIEIGVPAEHITEIDHEMQLPTPKQNPDREWDGQRFVHNVAKGATWEAFRIPGLIARDTTINKNTKGTASVQVVRRGQGAIPWTSHDTDILFGFTMAGEAILHSADQNPHQLKPGDAFVVPPGLKTRFDTVSDDFEMLEVSLPGIFQTKVE